MRDYLEELLEEWAEEDNPSVIGFAADSSPFSGAKGDGERIPYQTPGATISHQGEAGGTRERWLHGGIGPYIPKAGDAERDGWGNPSASAEPSQLPFQGRQGMADIKALRSRLRRGSMAARYRASAPAVLEMPERNYVREKSLLELDAAVRRDARRYDGGFELF